MTESYDEIRRQQERLDEIARIAEEEHSQEELEAAAARYRAKVAEEQKQRSLAELFPIEDDEREVKPKKKDTRKRVKSKGTGTPHLTSTQRAELARRYTEDDVPPKELAVEFGRSYETIISYLKKEGIFDPKKFRTGGPLGKPFRRPRESYKLQDTCAAGHDLTDPKNWRWAWKKTKDGKGKKRSGRACIPCVRERQNRYSQKKRDSKV